MAAANPHDILSLNYWLWEAVLAIVATVNAAALTLSATDRIHRFGEAARRA
jgi:hypothetical protein